MRNLSKKIQFIYIQEIIHSKTYLIKYYLIIQLETQSYKIAFSFVVLISSLDIKDKKKTNWPWHVQVCQMVVCSSSYTLHIFPRTLSRGRMSQKWKVCFSFWWRQWQNFVVFFFIKTLLKKYLKYTETIKQIFIFNFQCVLKRDNLLDEIFTHSFLNLQKCTKLVKFHCTVVNWKRIDVIQLIFYSY